MLWLYNMDSTFNIVQSHNDGAAPSANWRLLCPNGANLTLRPNAGVLLSWFGTRAAPQSAGAC